MTEEITALLVSAGDKTFEKLELALASQGIRAYRALSSAQVLALLEQPDSPQMIFTDRTVPDGRWADIVDWAAPHSMPVIVVPRLLNSDLYIQCLERGAFDFIVPPFVSADLAHIVRCAAWHRSHSLRQAGRRRLAVCMLRALLASRAESQIRRRGASSSASVESSQASC